MMKFREKDVDPLLAFSMFTMVVLLIIGLAMPGRIASTRAREKADCFSQPGKQRWSFASCETYHDGQWVDKDKVYFYE